MNILERLVTADKSGASVAGIVRLDAPPKALLIEVQGLEPHCSTVNIFCASPDSLKYILGNVPVIFTVYVPALA